MYRVTSLNFEAVNTMTENNSESVLRTTCERGISFAGADRAASHDESDRTTSNEYVLVSNGCVYLQLRNKCLSFPDDMYIRM
jgi:hypothetical protein